MSRHSSNCAMYTSLSNSNRLVTSGHRNRAYSTVAYVDESSCDPQNLTAKYKVAMRCFHTPSGQNAPLCPHVPQQNTRERTRIQRPIAASKYVFSVRCLSAHSASIVNLSPSLGWVGTGTPSSGVSTERD